MASPQAFVLRFLESWAARPALLSARSRSLAAPSGPFRIPGWPRANAPRESGTVPLFVPAAAPRRRFRFQPMCSRAYPNMPAKMRQAVHDEQYHRGRNLTPPSPHQEAEMRRRRVLACESVWRLDADFFDATCRVVPKRRHVCAVHSKTPPTLPISSVLNASWHSTRITRIKPDFSSPEGWHLCRLRLQNEPSSVRSDIFRICRPDGAEILIGFWFYKDAAPTAPRQGGQSSACRPPTSVLRPPAFTFSLQPLEAFPLSAF
jgi:hypothetical protein